MAKDEHLRILEKGVGSWNEWRNLNPGITPDLVTAHLDSVDLHGANLQRAKLARANLNNSNLSGTDLRWAKLPQAMLCNANLREANLDMAVLTEAIVREAEASAADLTQADLRGADLSRSVFDRANFKSVSLRSAHLTEANLTRASLVEADLTDADLSQVDLSHAVLIGASIRNTVLEHANLRDCLIGATILEGVDLSSASGLETVKHRSPSQISISTIYDSKGKIPEAFLRDAGVPESLIEYMHSLVTAAFEFYSCFISYSTKDEGFVRRLYDELQNKGVRCWFATHDMRPGRKLHEQIDQAIRVYEKLLLVLSPNSVHSEWVKTEIAKARQREIKEKKRILFPIRLNISIEQLQEWECFDVDAGKDSAREIREYFIPDFTNWQNWTSFEESLRLLLKGLRLADVKFGPKEL